MRRSSGGITVQLCDKDRGCCSQVQGLCGAAGSAPILRLVVVRASAHTPSLCRRENQGGIYSPAP